MPAKTLKRAKKERRARQADHLRHQITRAAARCFAEKGYEATTMRAIAQACGFTASSLYTYFHGKEEIFGALVDDVSSGSLAVFTSTMPESLSFEQKLELLFLRLLEFSEENRDALIFMSSVHRGGGGPSDASCDSHRRADAAFVDALRTWIDTHATDEDIGGHDRDDVGFFVWGVMHGFFVQWLTSPSSSKLADKVPVLSNLILKGLRP